MQQGKNNIISEINRIHQILGINKKTSEVILEAIGGGLLDELVAKLAKYAVDEGLDNTTKGLVRKLSSGEKRIIDPSGKVKKVPLTNDEIVSIIAQLRKSSDEGLKKIIKEYDDVIAEMIAKESIPNLLKSSIFRNKVREAINKNYTEDQAVIALRQIPEKSYGVYVSDVIKIFDDGVRKIYREFTGKVPDDVVDDFVDDAGKVVDDTGKVVDDTGKVVDDTGKVVDDASKTVEEKVEETLKNLENLKKEENIAEEILELAPIFVRYKGDQLDKWQELANRIQENIETANSPELDLSQTEDIDLLIKQDIEKLYDMSSKYVRALEAQVIGGLRTSTGEELTSWQKIDDYLTYIKDTYGDFGAWDVTNSKNPFWVWVRATLEAGFRHLTSPSILKVALKGIEKVSEYWSKGRGTAQALEKQVEAYARNIDTDMQGKVHFWENWLLPGSARGFPKTLETVGKLYKPNQFGEILKYVPKYRKVAAYLSLVGEKMIVIGMTQLYYTVLMGVIDIVNFWKTSNKVSLKYRPCVEEVSLAMKNGTFNPIVVDEKPDPSIPPCLLELLKSQEFVDKELQDFMIRAEFFSHGDAQDIMSHYLFKRWEADIYLNPFRWISGPIGNIMINFYTKWIYEIIDKEKKGEDFRYQNPLKGLSDWLKASNERLNSEGQQLLDSMNPQEKKELEEAMKILMAADSTDESSGKEIVVIPEPIK
jgi:hypothetical protein